MKPLLTLLEKRLPGKANRLDPAKFEHPAIGVIPGQDDLFCRCREG